MASPPESVEVAVGLVTDKVVSVVVARVEVPVMLAWPFMARLPAIVEVAVDEVETKDKAVDVAEVVRAPVRAMPPLAVNRPVNVEAPVTASVPPMAVLPVKVEAPVTAKVEAKVAAPVRVVAPVTANEDVKAAAPWTVKVDSKVEGDLDRKVSVLLPPKEAELEERLVKEPNWPEKDLAEKEPVALIEPVERWLVVMDWGLKAPLMVKLLRMVLPLTIRSLSKVVLSKTDNVAR